MKRKDLTSSKDFCPTTGQKVHKFSNYEYWDSQNPIRCDYCGFIDKSRSGTGPSG